jgi:uncharacterized protein YsxB (DUF464 family)
VKIQLKKEEKIIKVWVKSHLLRKRKEHNIVLAGVELLKISKVLFKPLRTTVITTEIKKG